MKAPPDERAMEKTMWALERAIAGRQFESDEDAAAFVNELASGDPTVPVFENPPTPVELAQSLLYSAWEEGDSLARIQLALKALHISRDCADAYVLLAEEAALDAEQARDLFAEGVQAGERALGREFFEENAGEFWGIVRSRPYMRARNGLAQVLWRMGQREEALAHFRDLLRLNPGDNQGIRWMLAPYLLEMNRDDELPQLFEQFADEPAPPIAYSRVLHLFRQGGDSEQARECLAQAVEHNPYVPRYLLGRKELPKRLQRYITPGGDDEAASYAEAGINAWRATPGALEWLDRYLQSRYARKPASA